MNKMIDEVQIQIDELKQEHSLVVQLSKSEKLKFE
jgi:hypothetical protein